MGDTRECPECKKQIRTSLFSKHMQVAHSGIKEKCPRCEKEIAFNNLARHVKQVHDNVRKQCPFCPSIQRISRVTSEKFMKMCASIALSAPRCSLLRLWRSTLERFIMALKEVPVRLQKLPFKKFNIHIKAVHNRESKKCSHCPKYFHPSSLL